MGCNNGRDLISKYLIEFASCILLFQDALTLWNPIALWGKCTLNSSKKGMKVHFYDPNPVIFQKTNLNNVVVHIFFHSQIHTTKIQT
jgi:hypothetical protein